MVRWVMILANALVFHVPRSLCMTFLTALSQFLLPLLSALTSLHRNHNSAYHQILQEV